MKPADHFTNFYSLPLEFIVGMKRGSGMFMTVEDLANCLRQSGYDVKVIEPALPNLSVKLFVVPPSHLMTGEDLSLEEEEKRV